MADALLTVVHREHLVSAMQHGLGSNGRLVSFGTDFWSEDARANPETFPSPIPAFIYAAMDGAGEPVPAATWRGIFVGYRRAESFAPGQLDLTRPPSTLGRRDPMLPPEQQEPDWAGYLLVDGLRELSPSEWIPLPRFRIGGKPFAATVVRHPLLVEAPSR
jgi:hypothetical protein